MNTVKKIGDIGKERLEDILLGLDETELPEPLIEDMRAKVRAEYDPLIDEHHTGWSRRPDLHTINLRPYHHWEDRGNVWVIVRKAAYADTKWAGEVMESTQ